MVILRLRLPLRKPGAVFLEASSLLESISLSPLRLVSYFAGGGLKYQMSFDPKLVLITSTLLCPTLRARFIGMGRGHPMLKRAPSSAECSPVTVSKFAMILNKEPSFHFVQGAANYVAGPVHLLL